MFLNNDINGILIHEELANYVRDQYRNIGYDQIYIEYDEQSKYKNCKIKNENCTYAKNTICIKSSELSENIINWLINLPWQ